MKPSIYQQNILDTIKNDKCNLLVNAKAGSGKTSTLVMIAEELFRQNKKCLFLAFNKEIVAELQRRMMNNSRVLIRTINSSGYAFVCSYLYKKYGKDNFEILVINGKTRRLVKEYINEHYLETIKEKKSDISEDPHLFRVFLDNVVDEFVTLVNFVRYYYIDFKDEDIVNNFLINTLGEGHLTEEEGIKNPAELVLNVITQLIEDFKNPEMDSKSGKYHIEIEFIDQLYLPMYLNLTIPYSMYEYLDYVLVDESQDLSVIQQLLVRKLTNTKTRYIFVGDEKQAIYGFSGADNYSISNIKSNFTLKTLPLNICYRCPETVIRLAQELVPEIESNKSREDKGILRIIKKDDLAEEIQSRRYDISTIE